MKNSNQIKKFVKEKYGQIAQQSANKCGCGCSCSAPDQETDFSDFSDNYSNIDGYVPEADLGLGCGLPTKYADIKEGDTVVDLGSGTGNDVFVAREIVGDTGKVIGIDMTEEMVKKAKWFNKQLGFKNVEFKLGEIEKLPLKDNTANVIVSNCVLNLVPDKQKAFNEIYRVLQPGGHFCVSDIVVNGNLPESIKGLAEMYAGCVAGAISQQDYLDIINNSGFTKINVHKAKNINLSTELLQNYISKEQIEEYQKSQTHIVSLTVTGYKK